jgi:DNA-binding MarR family transcriptional regulator
LSEKSVQTKAALDAIRKIVRGLNVSSRACEKVAGLTSAQIFILQKLRENGRLSLNELAEDTLTHQSTVSVVVSRLVENKLVARQPAAEDRRRLELTLTAKGAAALKKAPKTAQEKLIGSFNKMSMMRQRELVHVLSEWVALSGLGNAEPPMFFEEKD